MLNFITAVYIYKKHSIKSVKERQFVTPADFGTFDSNSNFHRGFFAVQSLQIAYDWMTISELPMFAVTFFP
jgi:hypothetical protein